MKGSIFFRRVVLTLTIALTTAPFNLWAVEEKPTYEELEQRVMDCKSR